MRHHQPLLQTLVIRFVVTAASVAAAESDWQPIECIPADLPAEAAYEPVRTVDDFEAAELTWAPTRSGQCARATLHRDTNERRGGEASLRVDYQFIGKPDYEYIQVRGKAEFATPGLGIGFWLKHDGVPFSLRLRVIDAGGEHHQTELLGSTKPGWQYVAGSLDGHSTAWGGDGNGRKDYPCRLSGICIDRPQKGFVRSGSLWIDDVAIVKPCKLESRPLKVETRKKRFGNLYAVGETVTLRATGLGDQVRWATADFFGHELARGEGPAAGTQVHFTLDRPGWFSCKLELIAGGVVVDTRTFACAALTDGAEPARSDFVGVCSHFGQNRYPLDTMDLMQRYGIDQYRDEISWRGYELQKGQYALPNYAAAFLERSAQLKMRPLLIFDYGNPHYDSGGFPNSPEAIAGFTAYAVDLARRTRGTISMFEVWNEWVGGCGMRNKPGTHDGEAYGRLLKPTYEAVKSAFPDLIVVGIGGEYGVYCADNVLGAIRTAGPNAMDAWSIHPYRYPRPPESSDLVGELTQIARRVADAGVRAKSWVTEIGYPTHRTTRGSSPPAQARYCVRTLALLQSTGVVEKVFWYDLKDDGLLRDYNEHNFGLIHHQRFNCAPKPGIVAMSVFIRMTGGAEFLDLEQCGDACAARYRRCDGRNVIVAWTGRGQASMRLIGEVAAAVDMMGAIRQPGAEIKLTETPVYVLGSGIVPEFRHTTDQPVESSSRRLP
ncbi:MAG: hypothetical protein ACYTG0_28960 [Planctomycetota bacterium]|jgi:hypothetical protein